MKRLPAIAIACVFGAFFLFFAEMSIEAMQFHRAGSIFMAGFCVLIDCALACGVVGAIWTAIAGWEP